MTNTCNHFGIIFCSFFSFRCVVEIFFFNFCVIFFTILNKFVGLNSDLYESKKTV